MQDGQERLGESASVRQVNLSPSKAPPRLDTNLYHKCAVSEVECHLFFRQRMRKYSAVITVTRRWFRHIYIYELSPERFKV